MSPLTSILDLAAEDGRYSRQELITWWDQDRLRASRVLIVGAGALGNEIAKCLALLGIGQLTIVDMDLVEHSNLARCVLFRDGDEGRAKAEVVAAAVVALNPDVQTRAFVGPVQAWGVAAFADVDLILAGLDSREARLWVSQAARKTGRTWVDGAIEGLRGVARVFLPEGACYECTMSEADREILAQRRRCSLLAAEEMATGKVPTNATTASLVAAVQVQEAVKVLVGRPDLLALGGSGWTYTGETLDSYVVSYTEDQWCSSHDRYGDLRPWPAGVSTLADLVALLGSELGGLDAVELEHDLVRRVSCHGCGTAEVVERPLWRLSSGDGLCASCGSELTLEAVRSLTPDDPLLQRTPVELELSAHDVVTFRRGERRVHVRTSELSA